MVERCLMAASLAVLVCHPSATIRCFKPKSRNNSPESERRRRPTPPPPSSTSKFKDTQSSLDNSSVSIASLSANTSISSPPPLPISKSGRVFDVVSELVEKHPSFGIVEAIFRSGWKNKRGLRIEKVLKVNHNLDVLNKYEEYREKVKSKSTKLCVIQTGRTPERLAVDGNELLRFHGGILTCSLGTNRISSICEKKCCGVCRMVTSSLSGAEESLALCQNSLRAHEKVAAESVVSSVRARKAIVVCRVIAGRVARYNEHGLVDGEEGGFDSVVCLSRDRSEGSEELVVFNAGAVLPCFVVVYDVKGSCLV